MTMIPGPRRVAIEMYIFTVKVVHTKQVVLCRARPPSGGEAGEVLDVANSLCSGVLWLPPFHLYHK